MARSAPTDENGQVMAATHDVLVALVGGRVDVDEDAQRPYHDRPTVLVRADGSDSLASVLAEATVQFERTHPGDYTDAGRSLAFYRGDPSEALVLTIPTTKFVTITSPGGLAIWHVAPSDASMDDLVLADRRKVFPGDPLRPYLIIDPHWGMAGQVPGGWDNFLQIWNILVDVAGSLELGRRIVRLTPQGRELLDRAAARWQRHRAAAIYTRELFEARGADIMDVIGTSRATATYQLADLMAWTGINDPEVAAEVGGWAGYQLDTATQSLLPNPEEDFVSLACDLPIELSIDDLGQDADEAHEQATQALSEHLIQRGYANPI